MRTTAAKRDFTMDYMKGLLVLLMILAHCIQFFGEADQPVQQRLSEYINLTTFPGFFFVFGYACNLAYFSKPFRSAAPKMLYNSLKILLAFYISSLAYFAFVKGKVYHRGFLLEVLGIRLYAGWSEFLISFAAVLLLSLLLFLPLGHMNLPGLGACFLLSLLLCVFMPYSAVKEPLAALFVGSAGHITYPVLQYFFYFAAGIYLSKKKAEINARILWIVSLLLSLPCAVLTLRDGRMPQRFPPSAYWLFGASFFICLYYLLCRTLANGSPRRRGFRLLCFWLSGMGSKSLAYLLLSNVLIFAVKSTNFYKPGSSVFLVGFYIAILGFIGFVTGDGKRIWKNGFREPACMQAFNQ